MFAAKVFEASAHDDQDLSSDTILTYVRRAPDFIQWTLTIEQFDGMLYSNKESAPSPDGFP